VVNADVSKFDFIISGSSLKGGPMWPGLGYLDPFNVELFPAETSTPVLSTASASFRF